MLLSTRKTLEYSAQKSALVQKVGVVDWAEPFLPADAEEGGGGGGGVAGPKTRG